MVSETTTLLSSTTTTDDETDDRVSISSLEIEPYHIPTKPFSGFHSCRSLAVLTGHIGSVSCLSLCGEFILTGSTGKDIIVWQNPDLRQFTKFGTGEGSVKAVLTVGNRVFTAHQDSRIRVWKVSRRSENVFRLVDTLPTKKDYLGKFMKQSNYVQTRRHHKRLWIEHGDSISCLAFFNGLIYSGSWDKCLKVWSVKDLKCLESIKAHDDAINSLATSKLSKPQSTGVVYSGSADGKIKVWSREGFGGHVLKGIMEGHRDVSVNSVVVSEDGKWVYSGLSDGFVMGWEMCGEFEKWEVVCEVKGHQLSVLCLCLVGEFLCSGSADKSIGVWRREAFGKICKVGVLNGHLGPVKCLQGAGNGFGGGFLVYSGGLDRSVRVWWVPKHCQDLESDEKNKNIICRR